MKKSKILVPAIALLALGVAGSATGTVAWFTASAATKSVQADTASIVAQAGVTSTDAFKVTAVLSESAYNGVYLTNDTGQTKLIVGSSNVVVTPTEGQGYATVGISFQIDYTGAAASASDVLSAWTQTVAAGGISFTFSDITEYNATNFPDATGHQSAADGRGLKFWTAVPAAPSYAGAATVTVTCAKADAIAVEFSGSAGSYSATCNPGLSVYVGVKGVDDLVQYSTDTYSFQCLPAFVA